MRESEHRLFILQIALKCADISNPCRPWDISRKWAYKVCEEFFRQGDYERQLNIPLTPLCDRRSTTIPKIQVGFFKFVVMPLYEEWHRFLGDGLSVALMDTLRTNQTQWETLLTQENAEETRTEISELDEADDNEISSEDETCHEDSESLDVQIPDPAATARRLSLSERIVIERIGRRHSVPVSSISKPLSLAVQSNAERRESCPSEHSDKPKIPIKLEAQEFFQRSSLSLLSSKSSIVESSANVSSQERPVSAENLLPEPSITSITNSLEASRLSSVLQPELQKPGGVAAATKQLTRQQTFPPLQPYMRMRYMSTTAEMTQCYTEVLVEGDSSSNSASPVQEQQSSSCQGGQGCGTPSGSRSASRSSSKRLSAPHCSRQLKDYDFIPVDLGKRRGSNLSDTARRTDCSESDLPMSDATSQWRSSSDSKFVLAEDKTDCGSNNLDASPLDIKALCKDAEVINRAFFFCFFKKKLIIDFPINFI